MRTSYESLPYGMEAVFLRQPNGSGTSARLSIYAGGLHETADTLVGTAHFLEHVAIFGGTKRHRTIQSLLQFMDQEDLDVQGYTDWTSTGIQIDGPSVESVIETCLEIGFAPRIEKNGVQRERVAISEEIRDLEFNTPQIDFDEYLRVLAGEHPSRKLYGPIEELELFTPDHLRAFHDLHWRPSNARFYVCSDAPKATQREIAKRVLEDLSLSNNDSPPSPVVLDLPWLKNPSLISSIAEGRAERQASLFQFFETEPCATFEEMVARNAAEDLLNIALFRQARFANPTAYWIESSYIELDNTNHGIEESYSCFEIGTALVTSGLPKAIETIRRTIGGIENSAGLAGSVLRKYEKWLRDKKYFPTYNIADELQASSQLYYQREYNPDAEREIVASLTTADVLRAAQDITSRQSTTFITSPYEHSVSLPRTTPKSRKN
jgi:predicted Zn-dependent peptidase